MNSLKTPKPLLAARMAFPLAASLITVLLGEWIARGALTADTVTSFIFPHAEAYLLAWLFLFLVWLLLDWIFRLPTLSTLGMAVLGCVPCAVNFYTLQLRGEPFLPWDLAQVSEAAGVASAAGIKIQTSMIVTVVVELALMAGSFFLYRGRHKQRWLPRVAGSAATAAALCLLIFGVYLQPAVCQAVGIVADPWMQDRYYRYYGVVTGFMTNLSNLEIDKPDGYSEEAVDAILDNVDESQKFSTSPLYPTSYAATTAKFALPSYLKTQGYQTAAVHCFWAKYWSRDTAYPNLGLDDFISLEDMHGVTKVRKHYWTNGLVTDDSMADQIIGQYEKMKASSDEPVFLHAVTMQNHTNYNKDNYPDDQRVKVLEHPAGMKASTVGALEDFATGIRDADAMLGKLTAYFSQVDEPVILVFWGDHYNPIDSNYDVYTTTGYASDSSADPRLHQTTLLLWSNYSDAQVDLGTIAAYDISPVMMNLYGLQQPLYFQFLNRQLRVASRACTRGVTMNLDGTTTLEPTEFQQRWTQEHWMLQYDLMFGKGYALTRMGLESVAEPAKGK